MPNPVQTPVLDQFAEEWGVQYRAGVPALLTRSDDPLPVYVAITNAIELFNSRARPARGRPPICPTMIAWDVASGWQLRTDPDEGVVGLTVPDFLRGAERVHRLRSTQRLCEQPIPDDASWELLSASSRENWILQAQRINLATYAGTASASFPAPVAALQFIDQLQQPRHAIFVLANLHRFQTNSVFYQWLQLLIDHKRLTGLDQAELDRRRQIHLIVPAGAQLDPELAQLFYELPLRTPDHQEIETVWIEAMIDNLAIERRSQGQEPEPISPELKRNLAAACQGLERKTIETVLASAIISRNGINEPMLGDLHRAKARAVSNSDGILRMVPDTELIDPDNLAGFEFIKEAAALAAHSLTPRAATRQLDPCRGYINVGMPGGGKSTMSLAIPAVFERVTGVRMPLITLNIAAIFGRYVGESESRWRRTESQLDSLRPAIIQIEELEKAFGGVSRGDDSSGVASRVFGQILDWMGRSAGEHSQRNYLVVTLNRPAAIPIEFFDRLDDVYFTDMPDLATRRAILQIHYRLRLARLGLELDAMGWSDDDWTAAAAATEDFTGRELVHSIVVKSLLLASRDRDMDFPSRGDVMTLIAAKQAMILAKSKAGAQQLAEIKEWCQAGAQPSHRLPVAPLAETVIPIAGRKGGRRGTHRLDMTS